MYHIVLLRIADTKRNALTIMSVDLNTFFQVGIIVHHTTKHIKKTLLIQQFVFNRWRLGAIGFAECRYAKISIPRLN